MGYLAAPVAFTTTFLLTVAAIGAVFASLTSSPSAPNRRGAKFVFAVGWAVYAAAQVLSGLAVGGRLAPAVPVIRLVSLGLVVAGMFAARAKLKGSHRLETAVGLLLVAEVMIVALRPASGSGWWFAAQALAIAGGVVLMMWLSSAFDVSIQFRYVTTFVTLLMLVVVLISTAMTQVFAANARTSALGQAEDEAKSLHRNLRAGYQEATSQARIMASLPALVAQVANRDPDLVKSAEAFQGPGRPFENADFIVFLAPGGGLLAISEKGADGTPTLDSLDIASLPGSGIVLSAMSGPSFKPAGGIDQLGGKLVLMGASPVYVPGTARTLAGVVAIGRVLNADYLRKLPADTDQAVSLITSDRVIASTVPGGTPLFRKVAPGNIVTRVFGSGSRAGIESPLGGTEYFNGFMPLVRQDNKGTLGALVVHQPSMVTDLVQRNVGTRLFLLALAATLVAILLSSVFAHRITRPIVSLTQAAERVRMGDLATRVEVQGSGEVGVLGAAFNQMTEAIGRLTAAFRDAAEEEFRLRSRLETILQSMTDGVIAVGTDGTIVAFNREAERMVGIRAEQAIGRRIENVLAVEDPSGARMPLLDGMRRDSIRGVIASLGSPGEVHGATRTPVAITSATVSDELGNTMGLVAVVRDLTPEIEVERMKTEFLSNVSHELRTPLTPIKGYANLMIRRDVPRAQAVGFLERIVQSTDRLERIVGMLVDFSAMEAGRLVPKAVPVNLGSVIDQLMVRWESASPKHTFQRAGLTGLPLLHLDQRLVPRAIDELIDNAVKFSPGGGRVLVTASLDAKVAHAGSRLVRITVSDQGIGIPRERLGGLAGGFVQIDASETREYGGLGLGLAYVRRIAESHGGYLEEPRSMPGKGSSFTIVLPAGVVDPSRPARPLDPPVPTSTPPVPTPPAEASPAPRDVEAPVAGPTAPATPAQPWPVPPAPAAPGAPAVPPAPGSRPGSDAAPGKPLEAKSQTKPAEAKAAAKPPAKPAAPAKPTHAKVPPRKPAAPRRALEIIPAPGPVEAAGARPPARPVGARTAAPAKVVAATNGANVVTAPIFGAPAQRVAVVRSNEVASRNVRATPPETKPSGRVPRGTAAERPRKVHIIPVDDEGTPMPVREASAADDASPKTPRSPR